MGKKNKGGLFEFCGDGDAGAFLRKEIHVSRRKPSFGREIHEGTSGREKIKENKFDIKSEKEII